MFFFPTAGFNLFPVFPAAMGEFSQGATLQVSPDHQRQQLDANTSMKTEYMSFPPPLQRSPLNTATERGYGRRFSGLADLSTPLSGVSEGHHTPVPCRSFKRFLFQNQILDRAAGCSRRRSLPRPRPPSPPSAPTRRSTSTGARRKASAACPTPPTPPPSQRPTRAAARRPPRPTWPPAARAAAGGAKGRAGAAKVPRSSPLTAEGLPLGFQHCFRTRLCSFPRPRERERQQRRRLRPGEGTLASTEGPEQESAGQAHPRETGQQDQTGQQAQRPVVGCASPSTLAPPASPPASPSLLSIHRVPNNALSFQSNPTSVVTFMFCICSLTSVCLARSLCLENALPL